MTNLKFNGLDLPKWFQEELYKRSPSPNHNTIVAILLEEYLMRNAPKPTPTGRYMVLDFGKYKGRAIVEVHSKYLEWCLENMDNLKPELRKAFEDELVMRDSNMKDDHPSGYEDFDSTEDIPF